MSKTIFISEFRPEFLCPFDPGLYKNECYYILYLGDTLMATYFSVLKPYYCEWYQVKIIFMYNLQNKQWHKKMY